MEKQELRIGVIQLASNNNVSDNIKYIVENLENMEKNHADLVILPEYPFVLGDAQTIKNNACTLASIDRDLGDYLRKFSFYCVIGGVPLRSPTGQLFDSLLVYDDDGKLITRYDKMHLFSTKDLPYDSIDEAEIFTPGNSLQSFVLYGWKIGTGLCFDLRFPEHFRKYFPCDLLLCPSAFLEFTGKSHWEPLLRARAIENQCYIVGANQCAPGYYGHSMICDPWGTVINEADNQPRSFISTLSKSRIAEVRQQIKIL